MKAICLTCLLRYSRGKLGKEGAALLQGMEDKLKVLERYF